MEKVNLDFKIWCKKVTTHGVDFMSKDQLALAALSRCEGCKWPWVKIPGVVLVFDHRLSKSVWSNSELKNRFGQFCLVDVRKRTLEVSVQNFFDSVLKERTFFYNSVNAVVVSLLLWLWCLFFFFKVEKSPAHNFKQSQICSNSYISPSVSCCLEAKNPSNEVVCKEIRPWGLCEFKCDIIIITIVVAVIWMCLCIEWINKKKKTQWRLGDNSSW